MDKLQILVLCNDLDESDLIGGLLHEAAQNPGIGLPNEVTTASTLIEGRELGLDQGFDVILLALDLPDSIGPEIVSSAKECCPDAAILVLTDSPDRQHVIPALNMGAQDYLQKSNLDAPGLGRAIIHSLERFQLMRTLELRTEALDRSEARSRMIIECAPDAILILNEIGQIVFHNPAAVRLFGREGDALDSSSLGLDLSRPISELQITRPDGSRVVAEMNLVPIEWYSRPGHLAALRDITQHKDVLRELDETRTRQLMVKDQFLSHVSHELRTPLTVVYQYVSLMLDGFDGDLSSEQLKHLQTVMRNCRHLEKMIEDLLEATRSDAGKLVVSAEHLDLESVMSEAVLEVQSILRMDGASFVMEVAPDLPPAFADVNRIRQVIVNLVSNAVKYGGTDPRIMIKAEINPEDDRYLQIAVVDDGPGIDPADQVHIFDHLYQIEGATGGQVEHSRQGLGLGLFISRQLIELHGGRIWVDSVPGEGAAFSFTIPVYSLVSFLQRIEPAVLEQGSLTQLRIQVTGHGGKPLLPFQWKYVEQVLNLVNSCTMPDRDLVLPAPANRNRGDTAIIFVVAGADEAGSDILKDRILAQAAEGGGMVSSTLELAIQVKAIPLPPAVETEDEEWASVVADRLLSVNREMSGQEPGR